MIRESLKEWETITEVLLQILESNVSKNREYVIQQIDELLEKREIIKSDILPPFNSDEMIFGQKLLNLEEELADKLNDFAKNISGDLEVNQKRKTSLHAYLNPYNKVFRDGTFYDAKK
ncbi:hypothetical protein [Ureibacillus sp. GCM10028918]|uniref:hypothetical protein n=1 Tax=Ureibacillus sp. GCM10028918 TaxID=3273429 RepID=UPI00360AF900